jgi:hypothetical protein
MFVLKLRGLLLLLKADTLALALTPPKTTPILKPAEACIYAESLADCCHPYPLVSCNGLAGLTD